MKMMIIYRALMYFKTIKVCNLGLWGFGVLGRLSVLENEKERRSV